MNTIFVINTHSFVDLITNSSSELFICDTQKTVKMVEELLRELLKKHAEFSDAPNSYAFSSVFKPISVAKFTFDMDLFPLDLVRIYKSYNEGRSGNHWNDPPIPTSYIIAAQEEADLQKIHAYWTNPTFQKSYDKMSKIVKAAREAAWRDWLKKLDIIWSQYGSEKFSIGGRLFIEFLKINKFSKKNISFMDGILSDAIAEYQVKNCGKYGIGWGFTDEKCPKNLLEAYEFFREFESWNMRVTKGQILVRSADDNSVPYELFKVIESYLHAQRHHLA